ADFNAHGFVWSRGGSTTIDLPGASQTLIYAINDEGQMAGISAGPDFILHAFLLDEDGGVTTIDLPGARHTFPRGINNRGQIVGNYQDAATGPRGSGSFVLTPNDD